VDSPRILIVDGPEADRRIRLMNRLGSSCRIVAAGSERGLEDRFRGTGIEYVYYPLRRGFNPAADLLALARLIQIVRRWKPDVVHGFSTKPSILGRIAGHVGSAPAVVGTVPGLGSLYVARGPLSRISRLLFDRGQKMAGRCAHATVFQNSDDARQFVDAGMVEADRAALIPGSGVDTGFYRPDRVSAGDRATLKGELGIRDGAPVVTMVSRVLRSKGVMEYAAAARELSSRCPDARFLLAGPDDRVSVEALTGSEREMLRGSLDWIGPRDDVRALLAVTDVFVLPTYYREGIPRVLLEAASMELPLVATRAPGCVEVVRDDVNGFLVPMRRSGEVADALARLLGDPGLRSRMGRASREIAVSRFDVDEIGRQTRGLYDHLLETGRVPPELDPALRDRASGEPVTRGAALPPPGEPPGVGRVARKDEDEERAAHRRQLDEPIRARGSSV
jgi:glycosyltransferase involved in cell wall biosynthesis